MAWNRLGKPQIQQRVPFPRALPGDIIISQRTGQKFKVEAVTAVGMGFTYSLSFKRGVVVDTVNIMEREFSMMQMKVLVTNGVQVMMTLVNEDA